jgi:hypothetical protein
MEYTRQSICQVTDYKFLNKTLHIVARQFLLTFVSTELTARVTNLNNKIKFSLHGEVMNLL